MLDIIIIKLIINLIS